MYEISQVTRIVDSFVMSQKFLAHTCETASH